MERRQLDQELKRFQGSKCSRALTTLLHSSLQALRPFLICRIRLSSCCWARWKVSLSRSSSKLSYPIVSLFFWLFFPFMTEKSPFLVSREFDRYFERWLEELLRLPCTDLSMKVELRSFIFSGSWKRSLDWLRMILHMDSSSMIIIVTFKFDLTYIRLLFQTLVSGVMPIEDTISTFISDRVDSTHPKMKSYK